MIANTVQKVPPRVGSQHAAFFRQSGWMVTATIVGGLMSFGVHFLSKRISENQYGIFGTLLMVTVVLPTLPLQMVFAQQTASAFADGRERQLSSMLRRTSFWIAVFWLALAAAVLAFQPTIMHRWKLTDPVSLWATLVMVLVSLWSPVFVGVLQGRQDFFWMGWVAILTNALRIGVAFLLVLGWSDGATGMMIGATSGAAVGMAICVWRTRDVLALPAARFDGKKLLREVAPLVLGFGAFQLMMTWDTLIAKAYFSGDAMAPYVAAGTMSRALLWVVLPLAAVMFPKIVHSTLKAERTNLLGIVLAGTAGLAVCGGAGLLVVGPWVVRAVFTPQYVAPTIALLPWYAGAIIPLALANVLINDLLARARFRVVPWLVAVAVAYAVALPYVLGHVAATLETVLQVLGAFNLLLLAVAAWVAFGVRKSRAPALRALATD